jgi:hypothetical protein
VSDTPTIIYLEADDEVTTVVRRLRQAEGERVVLVAPGRSRATSSVVALRLLARVGEEAGVTIAVAGDTLTRSLAAEAGLDTYASVEDARNARPAAPAEAPTRRASIHVVRGEAASDETAPVPLSSVVAPATAAPIEEATQQRPVAVVPRNAPASRPWWRAFPLAAILALLGLLVVGGGVLGAILLPAATILVTPRSEPIGPVEYEISVPDPDRTEGAVEAAATVTATGTYPIQAAASGVVVLFNFNTVEVLVEQGAFVAAGEQAFATAEAVAVPAGTLTSDGRIQAGEQAVGVTAAIVGEAANVPAAAIDTIVNEGTAARLRGFPNNPERLVVNPEATAGGVDTTGTEIIQADVDTAVAALRAGLDEQLAAALGSSGSAVFADAVEAPEPVIQGVDGLVGTRDQPEVQITGSLAYDRLSAERADVVALAEEQLASDASVLPSGHALLPDATRVTIGAARVEGEELVVAVGVTGASAPLPDPDEVLRRVRGRSAQAARAALADLGTATVDLWPGWVQSVPELDWRIDLRIDSVADGPVPSATP